MSDINTTIIYRPSWEVGRPEQCSEITPDAVRARIRSFYDCVNETLADGDFGQYAYFLNYGYVADDSPQYSSVELPAQYVNRNSTKLILEVVGDCVLTGRIVLDVGCGRGGTIHTIHTFFQPAHMSGCDLSPKAIEFCQKTHRMPNVSFQVGSADNLPFPDASFDVVTNVESSHCYPDIEAFYREVFRVLRPDGHFLYTDVFLSEKIATCLSLLKKTGFNMLRGRDITANVLQSCRQVAIMQLNAYGEGLGSQIMSEFVSAPGSQIYEDMVSGYKLYQVFKLRKMQRKS